MTNLEELHKECALKIQAAEIANRLETETGVKCSCFPFTWKNNTTFHARFGNLCSPISYEDAANILLLIPQTEDIKIHGEENEIFHRYRLTSKCEYKGRGLLEVSYKSNGIVICFKVYIEDSEDLKSFFRIDYRGVTDGEKQKFNIGTRWTGSVRDVRVKVFTFCGGKQLRFNDGSVICNENAIINQVISTIQYAGEFSSEE